jgi:hypothetical protein
MSDFGIKVTRPDKDVSSTTIRDFTIHSDYNILKIAKEGSGEFDMGAGSKGYPCITDTVSISHNLGYKPQVLFYFLHPDTAKWQISPGRIDDTDWNISATTEHTSDNNVNIIVEAFYNDFLEEWPDLEGVLYKYYILVEPREDAWYE